jgi:DHA1 family inner membrane transport protein
VYGSAEPMNFSPKFDSGKPADGNFLPIVPKRELELVEKPTERVEQAAEPVEPAPKLPSPREVRSLILRLSVVGFITALASRATDPVIPQIAHDIQVDPNAVALLTTAFALPFALVQPVLGPVGDMVGKVRVMIACLAVTILAMLVCGLATNFSTLLGARIVAGAAAGGIFPVGIAVIGDLVPVKDRQVAIGRWLAAVITGNLLGSSLAGVIGDLLGWRGVFFVITVLGVVSFVIAMVSLRKVVRAQPPQLSLSGFSRGYGAVFANPRAKVCFGAVFAEGIVIFGLFPFIALMLHMAGETRASIAGAVIAGFSVGGVAYALLVPKLVARWRPDQLMVGGGVFAALALAVVSFNPVWPVQLAAFTLLGLGFYTMHASIQVQASELAPASRGAAMSLHSFFFFVGHASGPVLYGLGFVSLGSALTVALAAIVAMAIGVVTARLLRERTSV